MTAQSFTIPTATYLGICILILFPYRAHAMRISELAWMGSNDSSSCEWIELYNDDDTSVDLTGWTLTIGSSTPRSIESSTETLIIPAYGYFVIARSGTTCAAYHTTIADYIMSMTLTDTGFSVVLKDLTGATAFSIPKESIAWTTFKDQNSSRDTLQWTGTAWTLATPTPGEPTVIPYTAETTSTATPETGVWHSSDSSTSRNLIRALRINAPDIAYRNVPVTFMSASSPRDARKYKSHVWNFGDLETSTLSSPVHTYRENGTYLVHLSVDDGDDTAIQTKEITVVDAPIALGRTPAGSVTVTNTGTAGLNLEGFTLGAFTVPKNSILLPGKTITIAANKIGNPQTPVVLYSPSAVMIAALEESAPVATTLAQTPETYARTSSLPYEPLPYMSEEPVPKLVAYASGAADTGTDAASTSSTSTSTASSSLEHAIPTPTPKKSFGILPLTALAGVLTLAIGASFIRSRAQ